MLLLTRPWSYEQDTQLWLPTAEQLVAAQLALEWQL